MQAKTRIIIIPSAIVIVRFPFLHLAFELNRRPRQRMILRNRVIALIYYVDPHLICSFLNKGADVTYKPMPCGNLLFTGRGDYLERLSAYFSPRADSHPRRLFLLYGVGGIGKTQISLKFAEENASQSVSNPPYVVSNMLSYRLPQVLANFLGGRDKRGDNGAQPPRHLYRPGRPKFGGRTYQ